MWNDAFDYTTEEDRAFTFWWFEGGMPGQPDPIPNPNNAVASLLGLTPPTLGDQCGLVYYHKANVTAEPSSFTECHPWHSASCCTEATVVTPTAMNNGYGPGFRWDRCGTLSPACERFFVQEACFYECEPTAGRYRKYSDAQFFACNPTGAYGANSPSGTVVTLADGSSYTCDGSENQWQIYRMPIKASVCDSWFRACAEDRFCGGGDYFQCANDFHADEGGYRARLDALQRNETRTAARAAELAAELERERAQNRSNDDDSLPGWAIALIAVGGVLAIGFGACALFMVGQEKQGKPIFKPMSGAVSVAKHDVASPSATEPDKM